jgi:hypothetical protein
MHINIFVPLFITDNLDSCKYSYTWCNLWSIFRILQFHYIYVKAWKIITNILLYIMESVCPFCMLVGIRELCHERAQHEQRTIGGQSILSVINNSYVVT